MFRNLGFTARIFLLSTTLVVIALGVAAIATYSRGSQIADAAAHASLTHSREVQQDLQTLHIQRLRLMSQLVATDPAFVSYVQEAGNNNDPFGGSQPGAGSNSVTNLLNERQTEIGFDLGLVLDPNGAPIAQTGRQTIHDNLSLDPVVSATMHTQQPKTGYWLRDGKLYQIAVAPLGNRDQLAGYLVLGLAIAQSQLQNVKRVSDSDLVMLDTSGGKYTPIIATLDAQRLVQLTQALTGRPVLPNNGFNLNLGGEHWLAYAASLDTGGSTSIALTLTSLDQAMGGFRAILFALFGAALLGLLLAMALSLWLSRQVAKPLRNLAHAAQAAARGDYQLDFKATKGGGEIGQVSQAFDSLLSDLREKSEIEAYMADLAKYQSDNAAEQSLLTAAVTSSLPKSGAGNTTPESLVTQAGNLTLDPRLHLTPGTVLAERYDILSELGSGGMAKVYKARDRQLGEVVALKMLKVDATKDSAALETIKNEIRLARKITHRNVLRTYDYGDANGMPFISMEYVPGVTLHHLLQNRSNLPYAAGLRIMRQVCAALQVAHSEGVLHRDIKPENVMLEPTGNAKLMDFGIAGTLKRGGDQPGTTLIMGTPRYASPEQLQGKPVDERTDIYACGVMMYQMFTGKTPFNKREFDELLAHKIKENYRSPESLVKDFPPAIAALIAACLKASPDARPRNAKRLLEALEKLRS